MKRRFLAHWVPLAAACAALTSPAQADIYAFVDGNGVRHLSNVPGDPRYKLVMRTPAYQKEATQLANSFAPSRSGGAMMPRDDGTTTTARRSVRLSKINEGHRERLTPEINRIAAQNNLDPALMHAVISAESGYNPFAVSNKGAMGIMQLMPGTAQRFGVSNAYDPIENMQGGARYLRWLLSRFNDPRLAVAGYNAGEGAVEKYGRQIPPYSETQNYVVKVLAYYDKYRGSVGASYASTRTDPQVAMNTPLRNPIAPAPRSGVVIVKAAHRPAHLTNVPNEAFPTTYFQPTGRQIVMGSSQAGSRPRVVSVTLPAVASSTFSGAER